MGTQGFVDSLRHFMRRDRFEFIIKQGEQQHQTTAAVTTQEPKRKKTKKNSSISDSFLDFTISALSFQHDYDSIDDDNVQQQQQQQQQQQVSIQSFIFETPPLVGRFRPDRAAALGIPKGPLYAQLKKGLSVTFSSKDGTEHTVQSHEVLEAGHPGIAVVVVYCPTTHVLQQLKDCKRLQAFQDKSTTTCVATTLDVVVHMTPRHMVKDADYQGWVQSFPTTTDHIWMDTYETADNNQNKETTPFVAASLGGMMRSMVHADIYPSPMQEQEPSSSADTVDDVPNTMIVGKRHLEYFLIPRSKCGIKEDAAPELLTERIEDARQMVKDSGALEIAAKAIYPIAAATSASKGEILFTGTGSALPCKHRNVTGICLTLANNNRMLLDCGEGTVGQLLRASNVLDLASIQAVWISHPHADHHLGILRLLSERKGRGEPIILIAPPTMFTFLSEYEVVDPTIRGSYLKLNCYDLVPPSKLNQEMSQLLESRLGITSIQAVPVSHCRHAFAVVMDCAGTLGRVAYSGDCRPSMKFADLALDADILIHEATFEDGMEEEAVLKKHSTVGEALMVAKRMRAKAVLLTHFSQRYPKMPLQKASPDDDRADLPIVFCFDFMTLTPDTIPLAAKLTDAMRLLYPEEVDKKSGENNDEADAKKIMSIPGIFAQSELL
jgi:ribonuclease Z